MNKKNLILGGVLLLLVLVAYLWQGPVKSMGEKRNKEKNFLAGLNVGQIDKIEISQGENITASVEKEGERWKVSGTKGFYVKNDIMAGVISALQSATKAELVLSGVNKEKKAQFNTQEGGNLVKLMRGGNPIIGFIVGKATGDFQGTYISQPLSDKTYKVPVNLSSVLVRSDWYDKEIFSSDKNTISKIRFQYPTTEFTVEREITTAAQEEADPEGEAPEPVIGEWTGVLPYKFKVDEEKIDKILNIMSNLMAMEIPPQTFDGTGLEKNSIIVEASGEGINNILMIGGARDPEDENSPYYAKKGDLDNIYLITGEQRDELEKQIRDLR